MDSRGLQFIACYSEHYSSTRTGNHEHGRRLAYCLIIEINANDGWKDFVLGADANDNTHYTTTVQWKVPYEWQGKYQKISLNNKIILN